MRRGFAVALVYIGLILVPVLLAALLVPPVVEQLNLLIDNLPRYVADLQQFISENDRLRELEEDYNITAELQKQASSLPGRSATPPGSSRTSAWDSSTRSSPASRSSSSACS